MTTKTILRSLVILVALTAAPLAMVAADKDGPAPLVEPLDVHTVVHHPFDLPAPDALAARESQARAAADAHPTVQALRAGSFAFVDEFEYTPERSYVHYRTWHQQRVTTLDDSLVLAHEAGYLARLAVDPATGQVVEAIVAPRAPEVVRETFAPTELEAIRIARADAGVQDEMRGWDAYPRLVFWRPDYLGMYGLCMMGGCAEVYFQGVTDGRQLRVTVDLRDDEVLAVHKTRWDSPIVAPPAVQPTALAIPPLGEPRGLDHNPIVAHGWDVSYSASATDGIQLDSTKHQDGSGAYHTVVYQAKIPFVRTWYDQCGTSPQDSCFTDELCNSPCEPYCDESDGCREHGIEMHSYTNGFYVHAEYYVGCDSSVWTATAYGCYKYEQRYTFYANGAFHPWLLISGPGFHLQPYFGAGHYYVPVFLDFDVAGPASDTSHQYTSGGWSAIATESGNNDGSPYDANGYKWRVSDGGGKNVRLRATEADDNAVWWPLAFQSPVGEAFPSSFDNNEDTTSTDLMFYYAARRHDGCLAAARCFVGPEVITNW